MAALQIVGMTCRLTGTDCIEWNQHLFKVACAPIHRSPFPHKAFKGLVHNKGHPEGTLNRGTGTASDSDRGEEARPLTTPPLLLLRLASMLSAWVVTGLFSLAVCWGDDRPMMLPRLSGCALGSAGIPPPAAASANL